MGNELLEMSVELLRQTVIDNPYIPKILNGHDFPSSPQAYFLTVPAEEAFYGGAAGGGKSVALLASALQYVMEPQYSAIIFRRSFTDLSQPGCLIPMSHEWLTGTKAKWSEQQHLWSFPSGATVGFGHLDSVNAHLNYKGAAFQCILYDELTDINPVHFRFLNSRLRRSKQNRAPLRVRGATNPGGLYHDYYKNYFISNGSSERVFVPARLHDNPGLDRDSYEKTLARLDPVTRAQLKDGDWDIKPEGNMFKREWFKIVQNVPARIKASVRAWDLAATPPTQKNPDPDYVAGCKMSAMDNGQCIIHGMKHDRLTPSGVEALVEHTAEVDGHGVSIGIEQEPGASGKTVIASYQNEILKSYAVYAISPTGDKEARAKPLSAACERGEVLLLDGPWIQEFLDELCPFPNVPHDDQVDAAAHAYNMLANENEPITDWGSVSTSGGN